MTQLSGATRPGRPLTWLYRVGGASGFAVAALLIAGLTGLAATLPFRDNWLIVIFKLHAGFGGDQAGRLYVVNALDILILGLVGAVCLALYAALRQDREIWRFVLFIVAISPFMGIPLFVATASIGRSAVIAAVLIISIFMLRSAVSWKRAASIGVLSGVLLAIGDVAPALVPPTAIVAVLFGIGYLLLVAWFLLVAGRLFRLERAMVPGQRGT